jgi:hypothetical protein
MAAGGGHGEKLSRRREQALAALLSEPTLAGAAAKAGVGERTLLRWLQRQDFKRAFREARRQIVEGSIATLQATTGEGVETLRRNLTNESASVQVRAAIAILDHAVKAVELVDLMERVEALEAEQRPTGKAA